MKKYFWNKVKRRVEKHTAFDFVFEVRTVSVAVTNTLTRNTLSCAPDARTFQPNGALTAEEEEEEGGEKGCRGVCGVFVGCL